jgi:hypothetical protein
MPRYLGMYNKRFNRELRPHLIEVRVRVQRVAFRSPAVSLVFD